jgi:5-(carboxyamino)imidazole ribonucleotide synthase
MDAFPILPPATIGILGGGQLGRMLGLAARGLGYRVAVLDPNSECPAAAIADRVFVGSYNDPAAGVELAGVSAVITYEFEQIDPAVVHAIEAVVPVRPGARPLSVARDRLAERAFLDGIGVPLAEWRPVWSEANLRAAVTALGFPVRLKAATGGYDGREQVRIGDAVGLDRAVADWANLANRPAVAERELDFESELSVVVARSVDGQVAAYPAVRNRHRDGILVETSAPSPATLDSRRRAERLAVQIASDLGMVGVLAVELFRMRDGALLVNELAPRVHNSGHWTIEGARTSQFEQHIRAICGLPLGSVEMVAPGAAMVNLLGDGAERTARPEGLERALRDPAVSVHLYDKRRVFERRKMGHVTVVADSMGEALGRARLAAAEIRWASESGESGS